MAVLCRCHQARDPARREVPHRNSTRSLPGHRVPLVRTECGLVAHHVRRVRIQHRRRAAVRGEGVASAGVGGVANALRVRRARSHRRPRTHTPQPPAPRRAPPILQTTTLRMETMRMGLCLQGAGAGVEPSRSSLLQRAHGHMLAAVCEVARHQLGPQYPQLVLRPPEPRRTPHPHPHRWLLPLHQPRRLNPKRVLRCLPLRPATQPTARRLHAGEAPAGAAACSLQKPSWSDCAPGTWWACTAALHRSPQSVLRLLPSSLPAVSRGSSSFPACCHVRTHLAASPVGD